MSSGIIRKLHIAACFFVMLFIALLPAAQAVEVSIANKSFEGVDTHLNAEETEEKTEEIVPVAIEESAVIESEVTAQNNYCSSPDTLNLGTNYYGYIDSSSDVDWFKFNLPSYGKVTVDLDVPFLKDYELEMYSSCSKLECSSTKGNSFDEQCTTNPVSGVVYAKVYGYRGSFSASSKYYIKGSFQASNNYDLVPGSFIITPSSPYEDDAFSIRYRVENQGNNGVDSYYNFKLYIDGFHYQTCASNEAEPGWIYYCDLGNVKLTAGQHVLKNVVDSEDYIKETNENNNVKTYTLNVNRKVLQYDLSAGNIVVTPANPYDTSQITIEGNVKNLGPDSINKAFTSILKVDGGLYKTCSYSSLAYNGNAYCSYTGRLNSGSHTIRFESDIDNTIAETNEGNNYKESNLYVQHDASQDYDLKVTNIWTDPVQPRGGESFKVSFEIDNLKPTSINKEFNNKLKVNGNFLGECYAYGLSDGKTFSCGVPGILLGSGSYPVEVIADYENAVAETDEGNNIGYKQIFVAQPPRYDVVVSSLWVEPSKVIDGQGFNAKFIVANLEDSAIPTSFIAKLYRGEDYLGYCTIPRGLTKGNGYPCMISVPGLSTGSYSLKAFADVNNDVGEVNEGNNQRIINLNVAPKPCAVPDGSSASCDCNYHSDCPSGYPYCQDEFPSPISDGYDACLAVKPFYCGDSICNNGETWGSCSKDCSAPLGRIYVDVKNNQRYPVTGAFVYLDDNFKGSTSSIGKIDFASGYGGKNVKVHCPDNSYCGAKSVSVDGNEYVGFQCGCQSNQYGDLEVYFYDPNNYPLINVIASIDGKPAVVSNAFGLVRNTRVPYGSHNLQLEVYLGKYDPVKKGTYSRVINVNQEKVVEKIVLRESDFQLRDTDYHVDSYGNVLSQNSTTQDFGAFSVPALIAAIAFAVDVGSITYSATELCKCLYKTDKLVDASLKCVETLGNCQTTGMNAQKCLDGIPDLPHAADECLDEATYLGLDAYSPGIPVGFGAAIGGFVVKAGKRFVFVEKTLNVFRWLGKFGKETWSYTKKLGNNIVTFIVKGGEKGLTRSMQLGRRTISWDDEAFEGLNKIIAEGSLKSADGLVEYLGEEGAKKLSRNIEKLSKKKDIVGLDRLNGEIADAARDLEEKILAKKPPNVIEGAKGRLKGPVFEAEVAAHPKYIDEVAEIRKPLTKNQGDIDILLKDGTIIDAKGRKFPVSGGTLEDIKKQGRKYALESPDKKIKFVFKREPADYSTELIKEEFENAKKIVKQEQGIDIELELLGGI